MKALTIRYENATCVGRKFMAVTTAVPLIMMLATVSPARDSGQSTSYFGALYPDGTSDAALSIYADSDPDDPNSQAVSGVTATVVTDDANYDILNSATWYTASGTTVSFPSGIIAAGATGVSWGGPTLSVNLDQDQWLLISMLLDGVQVYQGYELSDPSRTFPKVVNEANIPAAQITAIAGSRGPYSMVVRGTANHAVNNVTGSPPPSSTTPAPTSPSTAFSATWNSVGQGTDISCGWGAAVASGDITATVTVTVTEIPEPSTLGLVGASAIVLMAGGCRRRKAKA